MIKIKLNEKPFEVDCQELIYVIDDDGTEFNAEANITLSEDKIEYVEVSIFRPEDDLQPVNKPRLVKDIIDWLEENWTIKRELK